MTEQGPLGYCTVCNRVRWLGVTTHEEKDVPYGTCQSCVRELELTTELVEAEIAGHGFTIRYVDYCEDSRTPGLLGHYAGVTDRGRCEVKIRTKGRTPAEILETLAHEARHVREPEWDCGNRDVFGR
jgi:hypothetical protein